MTDRKQFRLWLKLAAVVVLVSLCRALSAQAPAAAAEWKTYSNSADGFSVSFPGMPNISKQPLRDDTGAGELNTYLVTSGTAALDVVVCDYGAGVRRVDPQTILAAAEKGALSKGIKAHILTDHRIKLGPYPGVEFEAENDTLHFNARFYLADTTLYELLASAPLNNRFADANRFFDSFQLIPRAAAPKP